MCGVVGVVSQSEVNQTIFDALTLLQHRGQDAAGILVCDKYQMSMRKSKGLLVEAIRSRHMQRLKGNMGIGHVRYPTAGGDSESEAQPFYVNSPYGLSLVHNGNLTNTKALRRELIEKDRRHLNTKSDSEILLNVLASRLDELEVSIFDFTADVFFDCIGSVFERCQGGYAACGLLAGMGIFAFRDVHGIRPLSMGVREVDGKQEVMFASESVAIERTGFTFVGDVAPGEAVFVDVEGNIHRKICKMACEHYPCVFEYVYLARPDSTLDGISVYTARLQMGERIADKIKHSYDLSDFDVVVPVPDSGRHAALAVASSLNIPYREGFVKNRYVGRTFIMPGQEVRKKSIRQKLSVIRDEFDGKHVVLVDDSIVRGNTSKEIILMAREAGARKVTIVSAAPAVSYPNVYGIDMPAHIELLAHNRTNKEIAEWIGADEVIYQDLDDLIDVLKNLNPSVKYFETSVFNGKYVTGNIDSAYFEDLEKIRSEASRNAEADGGEHGSDICMHNHQ
jgi:amidophosphoribosyltransferase